MLSTREIKRRIRGVKNIQQITKAMEMVAAARLRRAQSMAQSARPYFRKIEAMMERLRTTRLEVEHPLLAKREVKSIGLMPITSDKGLCGSYNSNIIRHSQQFLEEKKDFGLHLIPVGKKGFEFFKKHGYKIDFFFPQFTRQVALREIESMVKALTSGFVEGRFDEAYIIYGKFVSVMVSVPTTMKLLPIEKPEEGAPSADEYILEPSAEGLLSVLLPKYVEMMVYKAMVESIASEQGARMVAMRNATENAEEMIKALTMTYNKARQATITKELLEVTSGAEALKG